MSRGLQLGEAEGEELPDRDAVPSAVAESDAVVVAVRVEDGGLRLVLGCSPRGGYGLQITHAMQTHVTRMTCMARVT